MNGDRRLILHVGGPKCGSSALQGALSETPLLRGETGPGLAYTGVRTSGGGLRPVSGRALSMMARRSVHGYVSWPNLQRSDDPAPVFAALDRVWQGAGRGPVPMLSNEGWIVQAETFRHYLPHWFEPGRAAPVEVLGFARPPLDWLNAAYWQWGVWSGRSFQAWLQSNALPYRLGTALAAWAALPNTVASVHLSGDVLAAFEARYGLRLPPAATRNAALPPAMVGFLLRNRNFRPTAHDSATEFVFGRWCRVDGAPRLWAILPRHVPLIREKVEAEVETLFSFLPEAEAAALRREDPRWTSAAPYHDLLLRGMSRLDDPEELAQLYRAICRGVHAAAAAARERPPQLTPILGTAAPVHSWDVAIAAALGHLVRLDTALRRGRLTGWLFARPTTGATG